jgi:L-ascorbate metabolism protein UlaG (beta-lactamase superfamily)
MKIRYLGHSFFEISSGKNKILIDPFINYSPDESELIPLSKSSCCEKDFKGISMILVSHEHFDHFDKKAIEKIAERENCCVISHESVLNELTLSQNLLRPINSGEKISFRGIDVEAIPVHHPKAFYPLGFVVGVEGKKIFHSGDTALMDSFNNINANVAMLPIGGGVTMDLIDAVRATKTMKPDYVIPMHYNTFEQIKSDPFEFQQRIEKSILRTKPIIMKQGQTVKLY